MRRAEKTASLLAQAEDRLRAEGLTGARAFDALVRAIRARLGDDLEVLASAEEAIRDLPLDGELDLLGLAYETFFADLFKGKRGQFFTPRPLVELLVERAGVGPGDEVLDPTCGSGGFLVVAASRGARVRGVEIDPSLVSLARLNLRLAGLEGEVHQADFFRLEPDPVDLVVANPPFSVEIRDAEVLGRYQLGYGRDRVLSDWLFVEALERWVRPGGRAAVVLPWSLLVNPTHHPLRERVEAAWVREATCSLPEGVFRPFGGAAGRAALLWLRRRPAAAAPTLWAALSDPGYDVRSSRFQPTGSDQVQQLAAGAGWTELPPGAWVPAPSATTAPALPLPQLAEASQHTRVPARDPAAAFQVIDLASADKATGEVTRPLRAVGAHIKGAKVAVVPGAVLVSRLRPELGNVAIAPEEPREPMVGSGEWLQLRARRWPWFLLHALRTSAWRQQLEVTGGQTRPRTSLDAVLATQVPWPGEEVAERIDAVAAGIHRRRSSLRRQLERLEDAMERFGSGELGAADLLRVVEDLEDVDGC